LDGKTLFTQAQSSSKPIKIMILPIHRKDASSGTFYCLRGLFIFLGSSWQNISRSSEKFFKFGGFTLFELITVIFMIALVSTFAIPGIISWRSAAKLRGAAENLKGNLELAKLKAIQENGPVAIQFRADRYRIFVDTGANEGKLDADEELMKSVELPPGIRFDFNDIESTLSTVNDDGNWLKKTRFFGRGTADNGTAVLKNEQRTRAKKLKVSNLGRITLANYPLN
jgi:type II secretory pathway pseudopilin PulG